MDCELCHNKMDDSIEILGADICYSCFQEISTTPASAENYHIYKDVIKKILRNYIYEKVILDPVK